jgi:hypothetical protein
MAMQQSRTLGAALWIGTMLAAGAAADSYTVTIDPALPCGAKTGRVILFFITETGAEWAATSPLDGPFFDPPQPIASAGVENLRPGDSVVLTGESLAFPSSLDDLDGRIRVRVALDVDRTARSILDGVGNLLSEELVIEVSREDTEEAIDIPLSQIVGERTLPEGPANLRYVSLRSEMLSEFYGRDVFHRAGVALPNGYDDSNHPRQEWSAIYVVPGFGGREDGALGYAEMINVANDDLYPHAVYIVLDPDAPLGHHGFCDSENNGPRGTALIKEFIPYLEAQFRIVPRAEGRLLYGHSSGGWSALWLQLNWPEVFGGCWSSGPDPIDFSAFQYSNLYQDANLFTYAPAVPGNETPSYRVVDFEGRDVVHMTVRQEAAMEYVIDPYGGSGQQWDAWEAMWSPRDDSSGLPVPMFDPQTGAISRSAVEAWRKHDIFLKVRDEWEKLKPVLESKVRILCGEFDNYYLDRAVRRFKAMVEERSAGNWSGPGYVEIIQFAAHGSVVDIATPRIHEEMRQHLIACGLHD